MKMLSLGTVLLCGLIPALARAELPKPLVQGLKNPESVAIGGDGRIYVTVIGEFDKDGDGSVVVLQDGQAVPFVTGLDDPKGIVAFSNAFYVTDKTRVWKIDAQGKKEEFLPASAFPRKPLFLNDITVDPYNGMIYISDSGNLQGQHGAVYQVTPKKQVKLIADAQIIPGLHTPNGVACEGFSHLLIADFGTGKLYRLNLLDGKHTLIAEGFGGADGLTWDHFGRLIISDWKNGKLFLIPKEGAKPILLAEGFQAAADTCLDKAGLNVLVPDMKAGTLTAVPIVVPGAEVDLSPLPVETTLAFPNLQWTGWKGETEDGKVFPLRLIFLTHAGDGTNRIFAGTQHGVIHTFPNDQKAEKTTIFLDLQAKVAYSDKTNEEGLLGLAFHPKYKQNGEFFVFYTPKNEKLVNVVSRFKVSKDNPNQADPASEEQLLRFEKPFWNHNGGTIAFGPDGYLYITHGDGGSANDPLEHGQNLNSWLGKILRIDVDKKDPGKAYAIPKDNPFVGRTDARPEIWAYGLRNVWRMSFDRKTGQLWAADVGQNVYEEINLIRKGGNYGWNIREGYHAFLLKPNVAAQELIDPIWEYSHDLGKSITGGFVYRGSRVPALEGYYLYGDYVTNKLWALKYDEAKGRVTENRVIADRGLPPFSFGEDELGEVYLLTSTPTGKGIFWFTKK